MKIRQHRIFQELWKFLQVQSPKPPSSMRKLAFMGTAKWMDLPLLQRLSSLELPASEFADQINASQSSSNRHISPSAVQRRLRESGLHGWIAAKKPLLKNTNRKKRLAWAKKHEQWILDRWKSVLWSDKSKRAIFGSNHHVVGKRMISAFVVPTVKHWGGGVMVWGCFAGDLFRIQGALNQHGYHSILQR